MYTLSLGIALVGRTTTISVQIVRSDTELRSENVETIVSKSKT